MAMPANARFKVAILILAGSSLFESQGCGDLNDVARRLFTQEATAQLTVDITLLPL